MDSKNSQTLSAAETLLEIKHQLVTNEDFDQEEQFSDCSESKKLDTDEEYDEEKQVLNQIQHDENIYHHDSGKSMQLVNFSLKVLLLPNKFRVHFSN